jgi:hypothetical protein
VEAASPFFLLLAKAQHTWYTCSMDRPVRIQLYPAPEQAIALQETLAQFTLAFKALCAYGWQHQEKNVVRLHHATYPGLVSDLLIQARVKWLSASL